jgi:DNA-binding NtrC family response regulator
MQLLSTNSELHQHVEDFDTISLAELERRHIRRALTMTGGHLAHAAESLGIHRNTLRRKLQEYGMDAATQAPADIHDARNEAHDRRPYSRVAEGA